jgi:hypothetical protein
MFMFGSCTYGESSIINACCLRWILQRTFQKASVTKDDRVRNKDERTRIENVFASVALGTAANELERSVPLKSSLTQVFSERG